MVKNTSKNAKKPVKKNKQKNNKNKYKFKLDKRVVMIAGLVVFALFGAWFLRQSRAENLGLSSDPNQVVIQYTKEVPTEIEQSDSGLINYISKPYDVMITGDGSIYCDGVSTIKKGNIGKGKLQKIFSDALAVKDLPDESNVSEANVNNFEGIYLSDADTVKRVIIYPQDKTPAVFDSVAKKVDKLCESATEEVGSTDLEKLKKHYKDEADESAWNNLFNKFIEVRAEAAYYSWYDENDQINRISSARKSAGVKQLTRSKCLTDAARNWAKKMADSGTIFHSSLGSYVNKYCPNNWKALGENVGMGSTSTAIFNAFMNSSGHKANILKSSYNRVGVGTYRSNANKLFISQLFANCGSSCSGGYNSSPKPVSAITGHVDINSCSRVAGWLFNQYYPTSAATVHIYVSNPDGSGRVGYNYGPTNVSRPDVNNAYSFYGTSGNHGFDWSVPSTWRSKPHKVTVYGIDNILNPSIYSGSITCP